MFLVTCSDRDYPFKIVVGLTPMLAPSCAIVSLGKTLCSAVASLSGALVATSESAILVGNSIRLE